MTIFDPEAMLAPLEARASTLKASTAAPAVLVEAVREGRSATAAVGVDNLDTGVAARPGQTFEIGSQTKMLTAVAILQLADEGLIDLDSPAADWLPGSVTNGIPNANTATVRELLAMRSGIPNYTEAVDGNDRPLYLKALRNHPDRAFGPDEALAVARDMQASNAPGAAFDYSNTPYLLLGLLIEQVTGQTWAEALEERIFTPAGMTDTTARRFQSDPLRLSSYELRDGERVDVTDARWVTRGEAGVASTTSDMIAFLSALLVDRTLLPPDMLAEMTDFTSVGGGFAFGLGLYRVATGGGRTVIGFSGGTLGTSSATWYDPGSGTFVSMAATQDTASTNAPARLFGSDLDGLAAWDVADDGGRLEIRSVAAAAIALEVTPDGLRFAAGDASITLDRDLRAITSGNTTFRDGSVLVVGDDAFGSAGDDLANTISIRGDFRSALDADNRLVGLGGSDLLSGGRGADRIDGGLGGDRLNGGAGDDLIVGAAGPDRLTGGAGDDVLSAGAGHDHLVGGAGRDALTGGAGRDVFRFDDGHTPAGAADRILDFDPLRDTIDLGPVDAIVGGSDSSFVWIGAGRFSGEAGELRYAVAGDELRLRGDTDGDGQADLVILASHLDSLAADHFLL